MEYVSIVGVTTTGSGTNVIAKNLSQGNFTLSGPMNQSGAALVTTVSNAPPGDYTTHFGDVAFYQTPTNQSGTLAAGGTLNFTGNYDFIDANHNGISDAWEKFYFGSAPASRPWNPNRRQVGSWTST